jgi:LPS sulfotransferase NodH
MTVGSGHAGAGPPIFVVGVPRSGTTLLASLLARHPRLGCGPETNFFALARRSDWRSLLDSRRWPAAALDWLSRPTLENESLLERYGLDAGAVGSRLRARRPAVEAVLDGLLEAYLVGAGKHRWIEKSPVHLLHLETLRRHYPDAVVINIIRDPRDVALSLTDVPWGPSEFAGGLLYWRRFEEAGADFLATDRGAVTVRYEELVAEPERVLHAVCERIGEAFDPVMLHTGPEADALRRPHESWKEAVTRPLDPTRSQRWRRSLGGEQIRLAHLLVGDRIAAHGYEDGAQADGGGYVCVRPRTERLAEVSGLIDELAGGASRIWRRGAEERPRMGVYVGTPDRDGWLGYQSAKRLRATAAILSEVLRLRALGRSVRWIQSSPSGGEGYCGRILVAALSLLASERVRAGA